MRLGNRPPSQLHRWCINSELLTAQRHHLRAATPSRMRRRCPRCQERSAASPAAAKGFAATMPAAPEAAGVPADCCPPHSCTQPAKQPQWHMSSSRQQYRCLPVLVPECKPKHPRHVRGRRWCRCAAGAPGPERQGRAGELERDGTGLPGGLCLGGARPSPYWSWCSWLFPNASSALRALTDVLVLLGVARPTSGFYLAKALC